MIVSKRHVKHKNGNRAALVLLLTRRHGEHKESTKNYVATTFVIVFHNRVLVTLIRVLVITHIF